MRLVFLAVLIVLAAGCARSTPVKSAADMPSWARGASGYGSGYLTGVGSGATSQIASDRARSDLAKSISVSVESVEQSKKTATLTEYDSSFSSAVFTRASQTIQGVEIAERYYDEKNDLHYALAVLDKNAAASRLRAELARTQMEIDELLALSDRQASAIKRLKLLNGAEKLIEQRQADVAVFSALNGSVTPDYISETSIAAKKLEAVSSIKFAVSGDGEAKKLLSETLSALGFTLSGGGLEAIGKYENSVRSERGWQWAKAAIDIQIADAQNNEIAGAYRFEAEESAQNADTAKARALKSLRSKLKEELIGQIAN